MAAWDWTSPLGNNFDQSRKWKEGAFGYWEKRIFPLSLRIPFRRIHLRNIKTCFPCLHSLVKTEAKLWENSRADQWKPETQSRVFICSRILTNFAEVFNRLWRYGQHVIISFIKLYLSLLTKRKTINEACTVNSHNSDTVKWHCSRHLHAS